MQALQPHHRLQEAVVVRTHLVELINATDAPIPKHQRAGLQCIITGCLGQRIGIGMTEMLPITLGHLTI